MACKRRGGVSFTMKGHAYFNMVMIANVGGSGSVKNVWIRGSRMRSWVPLHRNWGAIWQTSVDLQRQKSSLSSSLWLMPKHLSSSMLLLLIGDMDKPFLPKPSLSHLNLINHHLIMNHTHNLNYTCTRKNRFLMLHGNQ